MWRIYNPLGRKGIIYTFGKTKFAIKIFLANVKNTDQKFPDQNFHLIGLESLKIP